MAYDRFDPGVLLLLVVAGASSFGLLASATSLSTEVGHERQPYFYAAWFLALSGLSGIQVSVRPYPFGAKTDMILGRNECDAAVYHSPIVRSKPAGRHRQK